MVNYFIKYIDMFNVDLTVKGAKEYRVRLKMNYEDAQILKEKLDVSTLE